MASETPQADAVEPAKVALGETDNYHAGTLSRLSNLKGCEMPDPVWRTTRRKHRYEKGLWMVWYQYSVTLPAKQRGFHLITRDIVQAVAELPGIRIGILHVFIQHTSAALTLNENADPDVRVDLASSLDALVPEGFPFQHTIEGSDDMPAHVKSSLMGYSLSIPVRNGKLVLGTWQGVYLGEFRNHGGRRRLVITLEGADQP